VPEHIILDETTKNLDSIVNQEVVLIEKIFCSNKHSGILLSNGEFWACGNCPGAGKAIIEAAAARTSTNEVSAQQED